MNTSENNLTLSKAVLSGLLTGMLAAALNLTYTFIYLEIVNISVPDDGIPVGHFAALPFLSVMLGCVYLLSRKYFAEATKWFVIFCFMVTAVLILWTTLNPYRYEGVLIPGFWGLYVGMEIITCLLSAFLIPYLVKRRKDGKLKSQVS